MGVAKDHWFETRPTHGISFKCPKCQFACSAYFHAPEPYEIMEEGDYHEEVVECLRCRSVWETIVTADEDTDAYEAMLSDKPDVDVDVFELDLSGDRDDWDDGYEPEPRAYDIFQAALKEWWQLLGKFGDPEGGAGSTNRMLFTQLYALLEAYLYSEIIGIAERDPAVQRGILKAMPALGDQPVKLSTVAERPALVAETIKAALIDFSFHKLEVVDSLCREACQKGMLPLDKDERALIMRSVHKRHDCVHRNGLTRAGEPVEDVTLDWLMSLAKAFETMAEVVQARVHEIDGYRLANEAFKDIDVPPEHSG